MRNAIEFAHPTGPAGSQASREEVNAALAVAERGLSAEIEPDEIASARATADRIGASAIATTGASRESRGHLATALRSALADRDDSVGNLVDATLAEVEATARSSLAVEGRSDDERERAILRYRHQLGGIIEALPGRFTLFQDPSLLALTPALVLDAPPRQRWGLIRPYKHPYLYVAMIIALIEAASIAAYYISAVAFHVGPHIVHP